MKRRPKKKRQKERKQKERKTPQARGWYRSGQFQRNNKTGILGNPGKEGIPGKRKRRMSIKRTGTFLGLCALGLGIAALARTPPQSFEEQVVSVHKRILSMPSEEIAAYDYLLVSLVEAGYTRLGPGDQSQTMGLLMDLTHPEARYDAGLAVYGSLDSETQYTLLEDTTESLALPERTELTDTMLSTLPEYARRDILTRYGSELIGGFYQGALDSAREGIRTLLDTLLNRNETQDGGEQR